MPPAVCVDVFGRVVPASQGGCCSSGEAQPAFAGEGGGGAGTHHLPQLARGGPARRHRIQEEGRLMMMPAWRRQLLLA